MDPDKCLDEIRELAEHMISDYHATESNGIDQDDALDLAMKLQALDEWIRKGGFKPQDWQ